MLKISIKPEWSLETDDKTASALPRLLQLLPAVEKEGNLRRAACKLGISYRHAWGLIRNGGKAFGAPLLKMSRGRGATLSPLGQKLLWADKRIAARLAPMLDSLASELQVEIERARYDAQPIVRIHASHGFAIELLRDFLAARHRPVDMKYRGSMEALASLAGSDCEIAGFHAPLGALEPEVLKFYEKWLRPDRQSLINLCTRRQGIMVPAGNPKGVVSLSDLARPDVRFVNRQFGSGTRVLLDMLLLRENLDSASICGYESGEFTHSGVAAYIASGLADAGFGVETAARRFQLDFVPVVTERYCLICEDDFLTSPLVSQILEILTSNQFRAAAGNLAGIDVTYAGTVMSLDEAFPQLAATPRAGAAQRDPRLRKVS